MVSATPISPRYVAPVIVAVVFTFLSGVTIILRYLSRRLGSEWKGDDWSLVAAWVFAVGYMLANVLCAIYGMAGYPIKEFDLSHFATYEKLLLSSNTCYACSISLSKVSILLMYRRIFPTPRFLLLTWPLFFLVAGWWISAVLVEIFGYSPIIGQWEPSVPSTHINEYVFVLVMSSIGMTTDILVLAMPQVRVWQLQMSSSRKILVGMVFGLGGLVCIASIVRLVYFTQVSYADPSVTLANASIWTSVEANMAIMCACLPTLPAIFTHWFGNKGEKPQLPMSASLRNRIIFGRAHPDRGESLSQLQGRDTSLASTLGSYPLHEQPVITHSVSGESRYKSNTFVHTQDQHDGVWVRRDFTMNENDGPGEV